MTDLQERREQTTTTAADEWHQTACILCSANCGVEVRLDGRRFARIRGNKAHVGSQGYTCEKALRLDHYQNMQGRLTAPMKRLPDGSYVEVDWDTAIREVADGFRGVVDRHGGDKILYYGGGGQGNHLGGAYGAATRRALGITRRSNALAQEKTGEAWVEGRMFGTHTHGHFADAEVAVFLGKNPWHSHGFDQARRVLKEIAADESRTMIVIDPRRTETADLADHWLAVKPGGDAYLLAAIAGALVDEGLADTAWLAANTTGAEETMALFRGLPIADLAERCGIDEAVIRAVARRLAGASSVAVYEDLGIEMAPNSTLVSYLQRAIWVLVGAYGEPGGMSAHSSLVPLFSYGASGNEPTDPVTGGPVISGLTPCNELADGVLSDHPDRVRAMLIESGNPVHSLAESDKFRRAMRKCEFTVVIDITMTETAEQADYVLPAASQYEKVETTFFGVGFPDNWACLRPPVLEPLAGTLPEPEIHTRLVRELGLLDDIDIEGLRAAADDGEEAFSQAFMEAAMSDPNVAGIGAIVLYETLGRTLPAGMEGAAALWFSAHQVAMRYPDAVRSAGFEGEGTELGAALWRELVSNPNGVVFTRHEHADSWTLLKTPDQKIQLAIPELFDDIRALVDEMPEYTSDEFPFVLSAGERRSFTANTIMRDPAWRKRDAEGALRLSPADAASIGVRDGDRVRITTPGGTAVAVAEVTDTMMDGHVALPNGLGLSYAPAGGDPELTGVAPNELTTTDWRDKIAGTPWHKHVPARLEAVAR
ncbi:MAG: molybdopterin-dependent oxidoreductase [Ilumatobacter sp.]|uniref:molybdopterin-dependent oxidoreductase n=1 Tax=Ilumatobacter sp. TaxID=1967498 RepID=UPI00260D8D0D|nr:molybdopterin-dependent oxidoreductase [Ilumatobacter sp.]MDJ0769683.1 molybdopterin-dependent oxidoreductase [Ilumatobacter sp.]